MELGAFLAAARAERKTFDLLYTGIPGETSLAHLEAMFATPRAGGALDYAGWHSAALDATFARARAATTDDAAHAAWRDAQGILLREAPAVWVFHARGVQGLARRLRHVTMDLRGELTTVAAWTADGS